MLTLSTLHRKGMHTAKLLMATLLFCSHLQAGNRDFSLGLGWNLGNQMDAHINGVANETSWGNRMATQQTFDSLRAYGFTSVRIPVTPGWAI